MKNFKYKMYYCLNAWFNSNVCFQFVCFVCVFYEGCYCLRLHRPYNWACCPSMMSCTHLSPADHISFSFKIDSSWSVNQIILSSVLIDKCGWYEFLYVISTHIQHAGSEKSPLSDLDFIKHETSYIVSMFFLSLRYDINKWCLILCLIVTALNFRWNVFQIRVQATSTLGATATCLLWAAIVTRLL